MLPICYVQDTAHQSTSTHKLPVCKEVPASGVALGTILFHTLLDRTKQPALFHSWTIQTHEKKVNWRCYEWSGP